MTNIILALGCVIIILGYWFYVYIKYTLYNTYVRYQHYSAHQGITLEATIIDQKIEYGKGNSPLIECIFEFPNFAGEFITERLKFNDSKPQLKRFEKGKTIPILLNKDSRAKHPFSLKELNVSINWVNIAFWSLLGSLYLGFSFYFIDQSITLIYADIEQYETLFKDMGLHYMFLLFLGLIIFNLFIIRLMGFKPLSFSAKVSSQKFKYYGLKAIGKITQYEDTGMMINDNPVVRFHYHFKDKSGQAQQGEDQLIINKLAVGTISNIKGKSIIYLPERPQQSILAENIGTNSVLKSSNLTGIFRFVGLISSIVIIILFTSIIWS